MIPNPGPDQLYRAHDLAVDPYSQMLYWSDLENNVINVTTLDMKGVGVLIGGKGQKPRSIALAPKHG